MLTNRPVIAINKQENHQYFLLLMRTLMKFFGARNTVNLPYAKEVGVIASSHHINDPGSGKATQSTNEGLILFNFYLG